jgi:hypothetical protein
VHADDNFDVRELNSICTQQTGPTERDKGESQLNLCVMHRWRANNTTVATVTLGMERA